MRTKLLMVVAVVCLLSTSVSGLVLGPPGADLEKGQWGFGANYLYSRQDLARTHLHERHWDDGILVYEGRHGLLTDDFTTQRYYGRIAYGVTDCWTIYGQLGGADVKMDQGEPGDSDWWGVNFDNDFAWGWGTGITLARGDKTDWGVTMQMNWLNTSASWRGSYSEPDYYESWKEEMDIETWDLVIAAGPTIKMAGWRLYGGPFYYYLNGDYRFKETGYWEEFDDGWTSGDWMWKVDADLRAEDHYGGYIGAQIDLCKNCNATIEFATTCGNLWSAGAGLMFLTK